MSSIEFLYRLLILLSSMGQNFEHNSNLIIMVDDELSIGSISNIMLTNNDFKVIANYDPGILTISEADYKILKESNLKLTLYLEYYEYIGKKQNYYNYEIPFSPEWLDKRYIVLRIYNLNKKPYKNKYDPLSNKQPYTFEVDYPGGSMRRITK